MSRPLLRAYVDETGDRGMKASSSPYFAFAAVIVRDAHRGRLVAGLDGLCSELRRPPGQQLHWSKNIKDHAARKVAVRTLAGLPVRLIYVVVPKASVRANSYLAKSSDGYYNYAARLMFERLGLFTRKIEKVDGAPSGSLRCKVTFAQVKGFHPNTLREYMDRVKRTRVHAAWSYLTPTIDVEGQGVERCLQWSDIAAGALDSAMRPDAYGQLEPVYFHTISGHVDRGPKGQWLKYGLKVLGDERCLTGLPWWPTEQK